MINVYLTYIFYLEQYFSYIQETKFTINIVFLRMFWNFISSLPVKRGGSLSFLVGTIGNVLVMEIGWTDVGSGGFILVSCAHSNTIFFWPHMHRVLLRIIKLILLCLFAHSILNFAWSNLSNYALIIFQVVYKFYMMTTWDWLISILRQQTE